MPNIRIFLLFNLLAMAFAWAAPCQALVDNVVLDGECKGVLRHGEFVGYHNNGMPLLLVNFKNDELHGKFMRFYPNGVPHFSGFYKHGRLNGKFTQHNVYDEILAAPTPPTTK